MNYSIINIREIIYSVGSLEKASQLFESYGGWNRVGSYATDRSMLDFWKLPPDASAEEILIQSNGIKNGQLRLIKFKNIEQRYIRSSQQPWDTGGIMDINLRVHEVHETFNTMRDMGLHGLSDPLLQEMGPFKLYDILMKSYDDTIIAFTHRLQPPMKLEADINFPTHVYKSSITVRNIDEAKKFYTDILGCKILNEYQVKKETPQENMFGLPHNIVDKVTCNAIILSIHGGADTDFQIVAFDGIEGKDFSNNAIAPHRGFLLYRVEVIGLREYYNSITKHGDYIHQNISHLTIEPYGEVDLFSVRSPNGVIWEFFETKT